MWETTIPRKYLPRVVKRHKLATSLLILQLLMGIAICTLAAWLLLWAPNLPFKDIPYWSGLPVLMASIIGIILLCSCRKEYPGMPVKYHVLAFKIMSMLASFGASVASFIAAGFAGHHLMRLHGMVCEPANVLVMPCVCRSRTDVLTYQDLNCVEVLSILTVLLIASISANAFAGLLSAWYLCLHLSSSSPYAYSQVRTNDNRPIILTNKN
ncbi:hypothetical protein GE061_004772 [Apolygus lucorum]|uniref:Uncharacterized protein n=1 Tax=Apolygus lucorum TaxID=248454 RepID=A0A6A4J7A6_APOLU|nr:hypothetical protein GE061_004772 [Apolygus lucorum]